MLNTIVIFKSGIKEFRNVIFIVILVLRLNVILTLKSCFVLSCDNNSSKNPEKLYFTLPYSKKRRGEWCEAVGTSPASLKPKSTAYGCSDHLNIEENCVGNKVKNDITPFIKKLDTQSNDVVAFTSFVSSRSSEDDANEVSQSLSESLCQSTFSEFSDYEWTPSTVNQSNISKNVEQRNITKDVEQRNEI